MDIQQIITSYHNVRSEIFSYLSDYSKNNILSCNSILYKIKKIIRFTEPVMINDKIYKLNYYDSFTNIFGYGLYKNTLPIYPKDYESKNKKKSYMRQKYLMSEWKAYHYRSTSHHTSYKKFKNNLNDDIIILPKNITHLTFDDYFNKPILPGHVPYGVVYLKLGHKFNKSLIIDTIPTSVKHLEFSYRFRKEITVGVIPNSVIYLYLGMEFNRPLIPNCIPESVIYLIFSSEFNQPLMIGTIPKNVLRLKLFNFNQIVLPYFIPESVTYLEFGSRFNQKLLIGSVPINVKYLDLFYNFNRKLKIGTIPSGVKYLKLNTSQIIKIGHIPSSVTNLCLGGRFNQTLMPGILPSSIYYLKVKHAKINLFYHENNIPDTLRILKINKKYVIPDYIKQNKKIEIRYNDSEYI